MTGSDVFGALLGIIAAAALGWAMYGFNGLLVGGLLSAVVVAFVLMRRDRSKPVG